MTTPLLTEATQDSARKLLAACGFWVAVWEEACKHTIYNSHTHITHCQCHTVWHSIRWVIVSPTGPATKQQQCSLM